MNEKLVGFAAILTAGFASVCCIGPLVLTGLGIGSLGLAAGLTQYRWMFLALTGIILAAGFYYAYRKRPVPCADGACEYRSGSRGMKAALWTATVLTLILATFPTWSARVLARGPATAPADAGIMALEVSGMTCASCAVSIEKEVEKVPGVYSARVDFESGQATVLTNDKIDPDAVLRAVGAAGYQAVVLERGDNGKPKS